MSPASVCQKSLSEFAAPGGETNRIIFRRGVYVVENTAHAARVAAACGRKAQSGVHLKKVLALF